jgi:hypothetical protein
MRGASRFLDGFGVLPLFHILVEEKVGERRLLFRWEVRREGIDLADENC